MFRRYLFLVLLAAALTALPKQAFAIPAFARATGTNCYACHTVYPELNQTGEDFKMHGYRFMSAEDAPWTWLDSANFLAGGTPLAVRASAYFAQASDHSLTPDGGGHDYPRVTNTFLPVGATLIAAGNLSDHFSIWLDHDFGSSDSANEAFLRINSIGTDLINVRVGSFEVDLPFSIAKTHNVFDYLIYDVADASGSLNPFSYGEPQIGVELSGHTSYLFHYSLALVNGSNNAQATNTYKSGYGRVAVGPYQLHVGVSGYAGSFGIAPFSGGLTNPYRTDQLQRGGVDIDSHLGHWRFYGAYLMAHDSAAIAANDKLNGYNYQGGFVQAEYMWEKPHVHFAVRGDAVQSKALKTMGAWTQERETAVTPQIIWAIRPDIQLKTAYQILQDPQGAHVRTLQSGIDWAVY